MKESKFTKPRSLQGYEHEEELEEALAELEAEIEMIEKWIRSGDTKKDLKQASIIKNNILKLRHW